MSLFDVIKYGNIDLEDATELSELPDDLFQKYRLAAFNHYRNSPNDNELKSVQLWSLTSAWEDSELEYSELLVLKRKIFTKVLLEHNNDDI